MHKDSADMRAAAQALLDRLYASHLPSDAALPHASVEWKDARTKADALRDLLATPSPAPAIAEIVERLREAYVQSLGSHQDRKYLMDAADFIESAIRANGGEG